MMAKLVEATLIIRGQPIRYFAHSKDLLGLVAKRLDCIEEDVVFKVAEGGSRPVETVIAEQAWSSLGKKAHVQIYAERKRKFHRKRKSAGSHDESNNSSAAETDGGLSSSSSASLKAPTRSLVAGAASSSRSGSQKRIKGAEVPAMSSDQMILRPSSTRRKWGVKDDSTLWKHFESAAKAFSSSSEITAEQREKFFYDLTLRPGLAGRSMDRVRSKLRMRLTNAVERRENIPDHYLKLFPMLYKKKQEALARQKGAYAAESEADSEESSDSESEDDFRPTRSAAKGSSAAARTSPRINEHNPFAGIAAVPPREFSRRGRPSWSKSARAEAAKGAPITEGSGPSRSHSDIVRPVEHAAMPSALPNSDKRTLATPFADSSIAFLDGHDEAADAVNAGLTSMSVEQAPAASISSAPPIRQYNRPIQQSTPAILGLSASGPTPGQARKQLPAPAHTSRQASASTTTTRQKPANVPAPTLAPTSAQVPGPIPVATRSSLPAPPFAAAPGVSNNASRSNAQCPVRVDQLYAIEIKSESEDEGQNRPQIATSASQVASPVAPDRSTARVKEEALEIRDAVRLHIRPIFPLKEPYILPPTEWASRLADWLKRNVLKHGTDVKSRIHQMAVVFDEFFYASYTWINEGWTIRTSAFITALLLLDLFDALGAEAEEARRGLVELLYLRLFDQSAPPLSGTNVEWPHFDICTTASLILPFRPAWLISLVFERSNHFAIQEVPPPSEQVEHFFSRILFLLKKVQAFQSYASSLQKIEVVISLSQIVYDAGIDAKVLSNLEAIHRQSKARVSAETNAKAEETIKLIHLLNDAAREQTAKRRISEESFFAEHLLLLSSMKEIDPQSLQGALTECHPVTTTRMTTWKKRFEASIQTWHLCLLQFKTAADREAAKKAMHRLLTTQPMQLLPDWRTNHSRCQTPRAKEEQQTWHRTCCSLLYHRHLHRRDVIRLEDQVKQE